MSGSSSSTTANIPKSFPDSGELRKDLSWRRRPSPRISCSVRSNHRSHRQKDDYATRSTQAPMSSWPILRMPNSPTWSNMVEGQANLIDAMKKTLLLRESRREELTSSTEKTATHFCRPRGWHLTEKHLVVDGEEMSASLFDFGLYFYHNAKADPARKRALLLPPEIGKPP